MINKSLEEYKQIIGSKFIWIYISSSTVWRGSCFKNRSVGIARRSQSAEISSFRSRGVTTMHEDRRDPRKRDAAWEQQVKVRHGTT